MPNVQFPRPSRNFVDLSQFLLPLLAQQAQAEQPIEAFEEPRSATQYASPAPRSMFDMPVSPEMSAFLQQSPRTRPLLFPEERGGRPTWFGRHPRATGLLEAGLLGAIQAGLGAGTYAHPLQPLAQLLGGMIQYPEMRRQRAMQEAMQPYQMLAPMLDIYAKEASAKADIARAGLYEAQAERAPRYPSIHQLGVRGAVPVWGLFDPVTGDVREVDLSALGLTGPVRPPSASDLEGYLADVEAEKGRPLEPSERVLARERFKRLGAIFNADERREAERRADFRLKQEEAYRLKLDQVIRDLSDPLAVVTRETMAGRPATVEGVVSRILADYENLQREYQDYVESEGYLTGTLTWNQYRKQLEGEKTPAGKRGTTRIYQGYEYTQQPDGTWKRGRKQR